MRIRGVVSMSTSLVFMCLAAFALFTGCTSKTPEHFGVFAVQSGQMIEIHENIHYGIWSGSLEDVNPVKLEAGKDLSFKIYMVTLPQKLILLPVVERWRTVDERRSAAVELVIRPIDTKTGQLAEIKLPKPLASGRYYIATGYELGPGNKGWAFSIE